MADPTSGTIDCYGLRWNWGTSQLEMNTGDETWVAVPLNANVTIDATTIDAGNSTNGQVLTSNGDGTAGWETPS